MKNLSRREQVLISVAAVLCAAYLLIFVLVLPSFSALNNAKLDNDALKYKKIEVTDRIASLPNLLSIRDSLIKKIDANEYGLLVIRDNDDISALVTNLCKSVELQPRSLTISRQRTQIGLPDGYQLPEGETNAVNSVLVTVTMEANADKIRALQQVVSQSSNIRIQSFSTFGSDGSTQVIFELFVKEVL